MQERQHCFGNKEKSNFTYVVHPRTTNIVLHDSQGKFIDRRLIFGGGQTHLPVAVLYQMPGFSLISCDKRLDQTSNTFCLLSESMMLKLKGRLMKLPKNR